MIPNECCLCSSSCLPVKQFCVLYRVDSAEIATEWVAYSHNKGNCLMNADGLEGLERDVSITCLSFIDDKLFQLHFPTIAIAKRHL